VRERDLIWQRALVAGEAAGERWLEFRSPTECERCARGEGCGAGLFARLFARRAGRLALSPDAAWPPGAWVQVGVPARWLLLAASLLYLSPVAAFVAGAVIAELVWPGRDWLALAGGSAGGVAAFVGARLLGRRAPPRVRVEPVASAGLESAAGCKHVDWSGVDAAPSDSSDNANTESKRKTL
jgi:sigma-E factor negative regulatory protein RseC